METDGDPLALRRLPTKAGRQFRALLPPVEVRPPKGVQNRAPVDKAFGGDSMTPVVLGSIVFGIVLMQAASDPFDRRIGAWVFAMGVAMAALAASLPN
jgi:hypothetical protein